MAVSKNILLDSTGQDIVEGLDDIATAIVEHTPESIIDDTTTSTSSTWSSYKINDELDDKLDVPVVSGTNGQFLGLENNVPNWKNISDAIISDAETSTSKVWSSGKVNTELSSINQAIVAQSAEIQLRATKQELKEANRRIHLLEEAAVGKLYTQETETETSYQQDVPSGSLSNAVLGMCGGKSVVWNQNLVIDRDRTQTAYGLDETIDQSAFTISIVGTPTSNSQFRAYLTTNDIPLVTGHKYFFNKNRLPANLGYRMQGAIGEITTGIFTAIDGQINDIVFMIKSFDPINVTFKPTLVDLTQMYGAGREPTETDVAIIAEIEAYALAHPEYNSGEIVSADVNDAFVQGENLLDPSARVIQRYLIWGTNDWKWSADSKTYAIPCEKNTTYTVVRKVISTDVFRASTISTEIPEDSDHADKLTDTTIKRNQTGTTISITTGSNSKYLIVQYSSAQPTSDIAIYKSDKAVYVPYHAEHHYIPSSVLSQYPLRSAGSVYDTITYEPITVDNVTVPKWYHTQNTKTITVDGSESISYISGNSVFRINVADCFVIDGATQSTVHTTSSIGDISWSQRTTVDVAIGNYYGGNLFIRNSNYTTVSDLVEWLQSNPIEINYQLDTPVVTDITDLMQSWDGILEVEEGGTITFKQENGTIFAVPNTVNYLVKTTGGA